MEIIRATAEGALEVTDITSAAVREEILLVMADYGLIYSDTKPADLRADLAYLRKCRIASERRDVATQQLLLRAAVTALLALVIAGVVSWIKGQ